MQQQQFSLKYNSSKYIRNFLENVEVLNKIFPPLDLERTISCCLWVVLSSYGNTLEMDNKLYFIFTTRRSLSSINSSDWVLGVTCHREMIDNPWRDSLSSQLSWSRPTRSINNEVKCLVFIVLHYSDKMHKFI